LKYLLDSNTVSDFYNESSDGHPKVHARFSLLKDADTVCISMLTLYELEYGYSNAPDDKRSVLRQIIAEVQQDFEMLPLSINGSRLFGKLKKLFKDYRGIKKENIKKHTVDIMLAASAIIESCILVTDDAIFSDLQKLNSDLRLENWLL